MVHLGGELLPIYSRFWHGLFAACDGNFKLRRTNVSSDERDLSLYDGLAYFVPLLVYKEWMKTNKAVRQEVSLRY
jgi:hypothetical protein